VLDAATHTDATLPPAPSPLVVTPPRVPSPLDVTPRVPSPLDVTPRVPSPLDVIPPHAKAPCARATDPMKAWMARRENGALGRFMGQRLVQEKRRGSPRMRPTRQSSAPCARDGLSCRFWARDLGRGRHVRLELAGAVRDPLVQPDP